MSPLPTARSTQGALDHALGVSWWASRSRSASSATNPLSRGSRYLSLQSINEPGDAATAAPGSGPASTLESGTGGPRSLRSKNSSQAHCVIEFRPLLANPNGEWRRRADWSEGGLGCREPEMCNDPLKPAKDIGYCSLLPMSHRHTRAARSHGQIY
jgi:hypothetical protein